MRILLFVVALMVGLAACQENTDPARFSDVAVSFATQGEGPSPVAESAKLASPMAFMDDTIVSGTDTLIVTSAEVVLREIEVERLETADCDSSGPGSGPEECEEFEAGPVLVALPLQPGAQAEFQLDIPPAVYTEIEFDIHKVDDDDPADAEFRQQHPDFIDISIRISGTFNGQSFLFESDLNVELELEFSPALVIEEATQTNITVFIEIDTWFLDASGALVDPATANKGGSNESLVEENIQQSIEAFEDEDFDGNR